MKTAENKSSREIERDVEHTRARMTETLDELRARMSPGQILDEVLGYARDTGGGKMMRNLGRTMQDNPAPLLLIGAGVAWMMAAGKPHRDEEPWHRGESSPDRSHGDGPGWADTAASVGESARQAGEQAAEKLSGMASAAAAAAGQLRDSATSTIQDWRDSASQAGGSAYRKSRDAGANIANILNEQPFVLGALGLDLGAALGAALPETEAEDNIMGKASDALKEQAAKGYEKAKSVAERTFDKAADEARAQGLSPGKAEDLVGDIAEKAGAILQTAKETAIDEASRQGLTDDVASKGIGKAPPS